jgi:molybdopterin molybdotransferase
MLDLGLIVALIGLTDCTTDTARYSRGILMPKTLLPRKLMPKSLLDDCFLHDRDRMRHDEALALLQSRLAPVVGQERLALDTALGRVLGAAAVARMPVPAHTNAAVDGYAFAAQDYDQTTGTTFQVQGRAAAGHPLNAPQVSGAATRIFTGAVLPAGQDTVVMQEDVTRDEAGGTIRAPPGLRAGANVRHAGEDVRAGATLADVGTVLRAQDLAALASIGLSDVSCFKRLTVGLLSTGDEVIAPGQPLQRGEVYDANAPMLRGLVAATGAAIVDLGIAPDDAVELQKVLAAAARHCNVIITSGGASRGEEDHMVAVLDQLGHRHLWQLAIKPGRPMAFGQIGDCVVLGLPGNPVAVFVCFLLYAWPMLRRLGGAAWPTPRHYLLPAAFTFANRKVGRREFWRGVLVEGAQGLSVEKFDRDGSGLISGLRAAHGLIDIPEDVVEVRPGDAVSFIPFSEFGILGG